MIRPITFIAFLLACGSGLYLYQTKHRVKLLDDQIAQVVKSTDTLREQTRMLNAEWTLLNDPERLQQLANQYLPNLQTVSPEQFTSLADLDSRLPPPAAPASQTTQPPAASVPVASNAEAPDADQAGAGNDADAARTTGDTELADAKPGDAKSAGARPADAVSADAKSADPKSADAMSSGARPAGAVSADATPAGSGPVAADDRSRAADRHASPRPVPVRVAAADAARLPVRHDADRHAADRHAADQSAAGQRAADRRLADQRLADQRLSDRRIAEQRLPPPRPFEPVSYTPPPRPARSVVAARAPAPVAGGSFLGMAHNMNAPAPVPLPRPMPMGGSTTFYGSGD